MAITKNRLILAGIFSPLSVPVLYFMGVYFLSGYTDQSSGHVEKLFQISLGFAFDSYFLTFVLGWPLLFILKHLNKINFVNCVLSSLILGMASGACFSIFTNSSLNGSSISFFAFFGGISAFIISIVFCVISGIQNAITKI